MTLDDLCGVFESLPFPDLGVDAHPERNAVLEARAAVGTAVADGEFLADCLSRELHRLEAGQFGAGLPPFFVLPGRGVQFSFGYWPPGGTPGPHEHTAWTITAVCWNEL